ncbi:TetR/AcrR family transcriptional regulator [Subtercola endophyticus]|uniref:TetR/AcrR family transcriptional regulator n=1 Tax=Subtercola endophyticus TaxID=2895559 RepID=UPI001E57FA72|nr:TetR/AcrR family transcriptional regulator [Subtercola endophyticus]UFS58205.1 TetR/AcrR family transcriptional regulator [Subtercola endophyticus]
MTDQKEALLERIVDYVLEHGVTQLTLRSLAATVDSNNRMLLYYFGSREELIVAALAGAETRFPSMAHVITSLDDESRPLDDRLLAAWQTISDPANLPFHRLFFEIFGLAGFEQQRFDAFLGEVGSQWIEHVAAAFEHSGVEPARATRFAHEVVALWRGFQATLLTGGDPAVIDRAAREATRALSDRAADVSSALQNRPSY